MIYYLIQAYSKQVDEKYSTHLYASYLTSYNLKIGGDSFGLQSGLHDALKFTDEVTANLWKLKGEEVYGKTKEFEIVPFDSRVFGRAKVQYLIKSDVKPIVNTVPFCTRCFGISAVPIDGKTNFCHNCGSGGTCIEIKRDESEYLQKNIQNAVNQARQV
jgi:hypothetical protein